MSYKNPFQEKLRQLDLELKKNMVGIKPLHHSTGDWDFETGADWDLDSGQYVSTPSSLRIMHIVLKHTLIKTAVVPIVNVKEGRIETYWRISSTATTNELRFVFRYQDADNYYFMRLFPGSYLIGRRKAGGETTFEEGSLISPSNTWTLKRITWWNDYVGIVMRLEKYNGEWSIVDTGYDSENNWKDSGGRCGFIIKRENTAGRYVWIDDTKIYGLPP